MPQRPRHRRAAAADDAVIARERLARTRDPRPAGWVPAPPHTPEAPGPRLPPGAEMPGAEMPGAEVPGAEMPGAEMPGPEAAGPVARIQVGRPAAGDPAGPAASAPARPAGRVGAAVADRVPAGLRGALVAPSSRALAGLAALAVAGLLLALALVWMSRPKGGPAPTLQRTTPAPSTSAPGAALVVHVAGAVRRPGVVELPAGSRVTDALAAAGGPARDAELASVNLARPLVDGEQLVVLAKGQAPPAGAGAGAGGPGGRAGGPGGGPVDLNSATLEQLDGLPGVGPVLAQRILDWRTEHGRFSSVDELREVSGIGDAKFASLKAKVRV